MDLYTVSEHRGMHLRLDRDDLDDLLDPHDLPQLSDHYHRVVAGLQWTDLGGIALGVWSTSTFES